jgi:hypothetical protein
MAMQEEHVMDIALNGKNYCLAIHRRQCYFVAGALVRTCGARMFTPQMIAGSMQKEGTYHFFEIKGTALSVGKEMPISRIVVAVPNATVVLLD